ncbi:hypothetical protein SAMN05421813_1591 [Daejeonella rubra]|uniref:Uncharacterized protein n=1 Tax=Daejeonella rubra TaxID=990371 RepID=A0A1G9Z678_9SPHI|nr:hypothetical protein SAMN05421813_1591 [Daejeonella rubra]
MLITAFKLEISPPIKGVFQLKYSTGVRILGLTYFQI